MFQIIQTNGQKDEKHSRQIQNRKFHQVQKPVPGLIPLFPAIIKTGSCSEQDFVWTAQSYEYRREYHAESGRIHKLSPEKAIPRHIIHLY